MLSTTGHVERPIRQQPLPAACAQRSHAIAPPASRSLFHDAIMARRSSDVWRAGGPSSPRSPRSPRSPFSFFLLVAAAAAAALLLLVPAASFAGLAQILRVVVVHFPHHTTLDRPRDVLDVHVVAVRTSIAASLVEGAAA